MVDKAKTYVFGDFRFIPSESLLLKDEVAVSLPPKALDVLENLVENAGSVVTKDDLLRRVWDDMAIEEAAVARTVFLVRTALGDDPKNHAFIQTVPKRGYRFVARVIELEASKINEQQSLDGGSEVAEALDTEDHDPPSRTTQAAGASGLQQILRPSVYLPLLLCLLAFLVAGYYRLGGSNEAQPVAVQEVKSIAVLPFKTIYTQGGDDSIGTGLSETLIVKLSSGQGLLVKRPGALIRETDSTPDPVKIGMELKTDAVLEGSVQKVGDRVRLTVRLVRVNDGTSVWAETFDDNFTNVFAVQDSISEKVVKALSVRLTGVEKRRLAKRYTDNADAYQQYLRGKFFWNKYTAEGFQKAGEYFTRAIELDPNYALAYSGLADTYMMLAVESYRPPREICPQAGVSAEKALSIDANLSEAHTSIGIYEIFCGYDWSRAESSFRRAIELNPQNSDARHFYSHFLQGMNRHDEAIAQINKALESEPFSLIINAEYGWAYYLAHRFDEALPLLRQTREMEPGFFLTYLPLAQTYIQRGMYTEAVAELKKAAELSGNHPAILSELACAYALNGRTSEATKILREFEAKATREFFDPYFIAAIYIALNEIDKAIEWMERSYEIRSNWMLWINAEPKMDPIRNDPRFQAIASRMNRS